MVNYAGGAKGALSGAGTGATIGSVIPGIGTGIGAGVGGLIGSLAGLFGDSDKDPFSTPGKTQRFDRYTDEQKQLISQLGSILGGGGNVPQEGLLGQLFGEQGFDAYKNPAMRAYFEEVIPGISERFTQAGAQRSSAFQNALARSGENLARDLGEMRSRQQQSLLGAILGQYMQPQFEQYYNPPGVSGFGQLAGQFGGALAKEGGARFADFLFDKSPLQQQIEEKEEKG